MVRPIWKQGNVGGTYDNLYGEVLEDEQSLDRRTHFQFSTSTFGVKSKEKNF